MAKSKHEAAVEKNEDENHEGKDISEKDDWVKKKRDALMVVASLMANMAFQAGLTPPGGLWQDNSNGNLTSPEEYSKPHKAGYSIMADSSSSMYNVYIAFNTTGFVASLSIILLLVSGLPFFTKKFFIAILTVVMWIAITATGVTYLISITTLTKSKTCSSAAIVVLVVWFCLMAILILGHFIRLLVRIIRFVGRMIMSLFRNPKKSSSRDSHGSHPRV